MSPETTTFFASFHLTVTGLIHLHETPFRCRVREFIEVEVKPVCSLLPGRYFISALALLLAMVVLNRRIVVCCALRRFCCPLREGRTMRVSVRWHVVGALVVFLCLSQGMFARSSSGRPPSRSRSSTSRSAGSRSGRTRSTGIRSGRTSATGIRSGRTPSAGSRSPRGSRSVGSLSSRSLSSGSLSSGIPSSRTRLGRSSSELRCTACVRDSEGRIARSSSARRKFERKNPKPGPGYVIDHVVPLKSGGGDSPSNMQWQSAADAKAKDKIE